MDQKGGLQYLTCVLRAYGLCYLSPIHAVLLIQNNPPSGATPRVRKRHKQENRGSEKKNKTRKSAWVCLRRGVAVRSWIS